jgi:ActR/RegA family two-component response regulator
LAGRSEDSGRVLLVHDDEAGRQPMVVAIAGLGFEVVEASTPVEAIWELENGPMDFHAAVVARELGPSDGNDIVRFISLRYPGVMRVLVGEGDPAEIDRDHVDAVLGESLATPELRKLFGHG